MRQEEVVRLSSGETVVCRQCAISWRDVHKLNILSSTVTSLLSNL